MFENGPWIVFKLMNSVIMAGSFVTSNPCLATELSSGIVLTLFALASHQVLIGYVLIALAGFVLVTSNPALVVAGQVVGDPGAALTLR